MEKDRGQEHRNDLVNDCWGMLCPKVADMKRLPNDPLRLLLWKQDLTLEYMRSILGTDHPVVQAFAKSSSGVPRFIEVYFDMISDTLRQWPVKNGMGRPLSPREALISALKYDCVVSNRYLPIFEVLSCLIPETTSTDSEFFLPLTYSVGGQVKTIEVPLPTGHAQAKDEFFPGRPAFGYRERDIPFDMILLHPKPRNFLGQLKKLGVLEYFRRCADGSFFLPERIRFGLSQLDYVMLYETGVSKVNTACHINNSAQNHGNGICLPIGGRPWLSWGKPVAQTPPKTYLAVPHEAQHALDDLDYPWGELGDFIITEIRAFWAEIETALGHGWRQDDYIQQSVMINLARNHAILQCDWDVSGLNHNDRHALATTRDLIYMAADHPQGTHILENTKKYLKAYLH